MSKQKFFNWLVTKRQLSKNSLRHTLIRYDYLFRWLGNRKLTEKSAEQFVLHLAEKGLRNASINSYIRVLNLIDIYERDHGKDLHLLKHIAYRKKQSKTPTILSVDEIDLLLSVDIEYALRNNATPKDMERVNQTYKLILWVLAATGCRFSEATSLRVFDVELGLTEGWVTFRDTKTSHDRKCPIPPILAHYLKKYIGGKNTHELVFTSSVGHLVTSQVFLKDLERRVKQAGITGKHIHPHCFRNSFIMEHLRQGTDPITLAKLVGHEDVNSTLGYTKYNQDDLLRGAERHPFFQRNTTPQQQLLKIRDMIRNMAILKDPRFTYQLREAGNAISLELAIK